MIDAIAFDADDTLWHTEMFYREAEQSFTDLLASYGLSPQQSQDVLHRYEVDNLKAFGYGIRGFTLSMIEAAVEATGGQVRGADVQTIVNLGRRMTEHPINLIDGVEEVLSRMAGRRLLMITKGDALDQEAKIQRSGLGGYFPVIEILVDKTTPTYAALLSKHAIDPSRFMMVGNSLRSDIAPVLALGGYAVYVPYPLGWAHESVAELPEDRSRFFEISNLRQLPDLVEKINGGSQGKA